jgi:hypothetical protein
VSGGGVRLGVGGGYSSLESERLVERDLADFGDSGFVEEVGGLLEEIRVIGKNFIGFIQEHLTAPSTHEVHLLVQVRPARGSLFHLSQVVQSARYPCQRSVCGTLDSG